MKIAESKVQVFQGRLMSPNDVRSAIRQRGCVVPSEYQHSWYLCGDVTHEFFRRVVSHEKITQSISSFRVNGSTAFVVFCLQIREHQARFLLPLVTEKSLRFVEQVERTGVFLSLGRAGNREALLVEFIDEEGKLKELRRAVSNCARLPRDIDLVELRLASYSMTQRCSVPSNAPRQIVSEVCLSVVLDD